MQHLAPSLLLIMLSKNSMALDVQLHALLVARSERKKTGLTAQFDCPPCKTAGHEAVVQARSIVYAA